MQMQIELRPLDSIRPYPGNPRQNDQAVDSVAASLREFGFRQPIVVDAEGVIIAGHTRYKAAQKLGLAQVPVHVATDLSPAQVKAYRIADNQTASIAEWDYQLLPIELSAMQEMNFDLGLLGFDQEELSRIMSGTREQGLTEPDEVPATPEEAISRPGDLWVLGEHRLLCGDSTRPENIERLMAGATARMMFTDPPWNVAIGQDSNPRHRQRRGLVNDDISEDGFQAMLDGFMAAVGPHFSNDIYCVMGTNQWPTLDATLRSHGYHWSGTIIWVKDSFVLGRSKYHRRYEPIWYGWHEAGGSSFNNRRDADDVWEVPRPKRSEEHPTMKPVDLVARAIENSSAPGDIVIDPFGGSGTTLIAAEQTGRKAMLVELDPLYCDVIVQRWAKFTGKKAWRAETGATEEAANAGEPTERTPAELAGVGAEAM